MSTEPHVRFVRCLSVLLVGLLLCGGVMGEAARASTQNAPAAGDWERLQTLRRGTDVRFDFVDGSRLEGRLIRVSADAIELKLAQEWRQNGQATSKKNVPLQVTLTSVRQNVSSLEISPLGGVLAKETPTASASQSARAAQEPASPVRQVAKGVVKIAMGNPMVARDGDGAVTFVGVKNLSAMPVEGFRMSVHYLNPTGTVELASGTGSIPGLLMPGQTQTVTIRHRYYTLAAEHNAWYEVRHAHGAVDIDTLVRCNSRCAQKCFGSGEVEAWRPR